VVLAGVEERGYLRLTGRLIVDDADLMELFIMKVTCTRELLLDLWMDAARDKARLQIGWVSQYNMIKAHWAMNRTRHLTNAPSLYVACNPESILLKNLPDYRGLARDPNFFNDFISSFRKLALTLDSADKMGDGTIPSYLFQATH
jgi:hypothetical protein